MTIGPIRWASFLVARTINTARRINAATSNAVLSAVKWATQLYEAAERIVKA
jgi:hypothetical protein